MPKDPLMVQAKRDIRIANRPARQAIRRAARSGKQDFNEAQQRVAQVTGALLGQLGQIPGAYAGQTGGIIGNVTSGIGALGEQLGQNSIGNVPVAEQAAGIANVGAIGSGAIEQIAGQQQNMADYLASGAQQGAVQGAVTSRNYLHDYAKFQKDIRQQKVDLAKGSADAILQRLDQLKQERFDRTMALKQLGMQQAQIDAANRALDAQIELEEARAKWLRNHPGGHGPNNDTTTEDTTTTTPTTVPSPLGGYGYNVLDPSVTNPPTEHMRPAFTANTPPETVLQWMQTQPQQLVAQAGGDIAQWVRSKVGQSAFVQITEGGALQVQSYGFPLDPGVQNVINTYNAKIGGA